MVQPLFSVVVANYNNGRFLPQLVNSLLKQTYLNWELVIADDASTDDSLQYIKKVAGEHANVKYVCHEVNQGAGATFKSATDASVGELVGMLGADDALVEDALQKMYDAHELYPDASLITSRAYDCDEEMNVTGVCDIGNEQPEGVSFLYEVAISNFVTFKRAAYQKTSGFDPQQIRAVDHDIFLKLEEVGTVKFVDEPLYLYRRHSGGISQGSNGMKAATFSLRAKLNAYDRRRAANYQPNFTEQEYQQSAWAYYTRGANMFRQQGEYSKSAGFNIKSLKYKPGYLFARPFWGAFYHIIKSAVAK